MNWDLRKTVVGVASLAGLLIAYLIYTRSFHTPEIPVRGNDASQGSLGGDPRSGSPGRIGGVKVEAENVVYEDRDDQGRLVRRWGFDDLWHRGQDVWEVKKPFVELFLQDANCVITADGGRFTLQSGQGRPSPNEGALSGHVVIQIQPRPGSRVPACQADLDDITFVGTTSRFTSTGRIRFVSDTIQWSGRQAEFLYDDQAQRLEYFRLAHLESLVLKWPKHGPRPGTATPDSPGTGPVAQGQYYQCMLRDRVRVQTAEQVVSVEQVLLLTEVPWSRSAAGPGPSASPSPNQAAGAIAETYEWTEVTVACDGPMLVTPSGMAIPADVNGPDSATKPTVSQPPEGLGWLSSRTLQVNARTRDAVAEGPVEVRFLAKDVVAMGNQGLVPVRITAGRRGSYEGRAHRLLLEGPCLGTLVRQQDGVVEQYTLAAPRLTADLLEDPDQQTLVPTQDLGFLRAEGGPVELRMETKAGDSRAGPPDLGAAINGPLPSGARMTCTQLDWDPRSPGQVITALGPGTIWLNNSASHKAVRGADKGQPFYALVRQFDTLQYMGACHRIVAEGRSQPLLVDYFPTVDGRQDQHIRAEANVVQIDLVQTSPRDMDLGTLTATGSVYYDDQEHRFTARRLAYDHGTYWMDMSAPDNQPCSADGVAVRGIHFNLKTKQLQTQVVAPALWLMH